MVVGVWQGRGLLHFRAEIPGPWVSQMHFSSVLLCTEKLRPKDGERLTRGPSV